MKRRTFLASGIGAGLLGRTCRASADAALPLRFVPQSDLPGVDPVANTATVTRNFGYLVYDTLYGLDEDYQPRPQMLAGHVMEQDGRVWRLKLRDGLRFHDGQPVLARDAVASIRRWAARDSLGGTMLSMTESLQALGDDQIEFRFRKPFTLLPNALGKLSPNMSCIMPERLATTDPFVPVREVVGSGPFRFEAAEFVPGAHVVYTRFGGYVPRSGETVGLTSGPKLAHFDRVVWTIMPDAQAALGALQAGEIDWWERPMPDLLPLLRRDRGIELAVKEHTGLIPFMRFNTLQPPFDNVAIRRVVLHAIVQKDFMTAVAGDDRTLWRDGVGVFPPGTPFANDAGMEQFATRPTDKELRQQLAEAGYRGERTVLIVGDDPIINAVGQVAADLLGRIGMVVDLQMMDTGTMLQRRTSKEPVDRGGWSCFFVPVTGVDMLDPSVSFAARGIGADPGSWYGWPTSPELEALHTEWFSAEDQAARLDLAKRIQIQVWKDVTYVPLGQLLLPTSFRRAISGVLDGFPKFYNVQRG